MGVLLASCMGSAKLDYGQSASDERQFQHMSKLPGTVSPQVEHFQSGRADSGAARSPSASGNATSEVEPVPDGAGNPAKRYPHDRTTSNETTTVIASVAVPIIQSSSVNS